MGVNGTGVTSRGCHTLRWPVGDMLGLEGHGVVTKAEMLVESLIGKHGR